MKHNLKGDHLILSYLFVDRRKLVVNTRTAAPEFVFPWRSRIPFSKMYSVYWQWEGINDDMTFLVTYRSNVTIQRTFFKVRSAVRNFPYLIKPISIPLFYSPVIKPISISRFYSLLMKPISIPLLFFACCYSHLIKPMYYFPVLLSHNQSYLSLFTVWSQIHDWSSCRTTTLFRRKRQCVIDLSFSYVYTGQFDFQ